jgi:hypothetical protein
MTNDELLEEIRELRKDVKRLHEEFFLFKGKAFGFITLLSTVISYAIDFIKHK